MQHILLGNFISFIGSCFMAGSCIVKDRSRVFFFQFIASGFMTASCLVLQAYTGAVSMLLCTVRNLLVSRGKYSRRTMLVFCVLSVALGLPANTRGLLGLLPIAATVQYTACSYYAATIKAVRWSVLVNVLLWTLYNLAVWDFSSAVSNSIMALLCIRDLARMRRTESR